MNEMNTKLKDLADDNSILYQKYAAVVQQLDSTKSESQKQLEQSRSTGESSRKTLETLILMAEHQLVEVLSAQRKLAAGHEDSLNKSFVFEDLVHFYSNRGSYTPVHMLQLYRKSQLGLMQLTNEFAMDKIKETVFRILTRTNKLHGNISSFKNNIRSFI